MTNEELDSAIVKACGCLAVVSLFIICAGAGLAVIGPKVWAWLKPILQGWLA